MGENKSAEQRARDVYERLQKEMDDHLQAEADRNRHPAEVELEAAQAEIAALRDIIAALVNIEDDDFWQVCHDTDSLPYGYECMYCETHGFRDFKHKSDCPITRGRAKLANDARG